MKIKAIGLLCISFFVLNRNYSHAQVSNDFISKSVMKVLVEYDDGQESATGFLWKDKRTLVTSYHVVKAGYKSIIVQDVFGWKARAKISKVYKPADLMLLEITTEPGEKWLPFTDVDNEVNVGEKTKAYGYNGTASGIVPISLEKTTTIPGETLYFALPHEDRKAIQALGFPSLKLPIMYLIGSLLPGYSGSPILNDQGRLVAIGDGGLDRGTTNSSWGIPVENLDKLSSSNAQPAANGSSRLFSSKSTNEENRINANEYKLNDGHDFFYTKTVKLKDIIDHSDDPDMLEVLLESYQDFGFDLENLEFEIYQEVTSNYIFVAPKGAKIESMGNYLKMTGFDDNLWATFTPGGVVKSSLQEFSDWTQESSDENIDFELISSEEFQTTSEGIMRMVDLLEFEKDSDIITKYWVKKALDVHNNTAFIQARTWLKDLDANAFVDCMVAEKGNECSTEVKSRVKLAVTVNLMMRLMTIANTKVLYIDPMKRVNWAQRQLLISYPEQLPITKVSEEKLTIGEDNFIISLSADDKETANTYESLVDFLSGWGSRLPDWELHEGSTPDKVIDINGYKAVFSFYTTPSGLNGLLLAAYHPDQPETRYNLIVAFPDEKQDTVEEVIRRLGK